MDNADFEVRDFENGGEIGIVALTARAQKARSLEAGATIAFKSRVEALEYVEAGEADGFTFVGREHLTLR